MLLVGILVKVEVAISLIELALLPVKRSVGFFSKKRNYPFGTATSSNFWTLQSPLRVSPPWSTRPWKAGSMTASHMAGLSSLLFLRRVPDPPLHLLPYRSCSLSRTPPSAVYLHFCHWYWLPFGCDTVSWMSEWEWGNSCFRFPSRPQPFFVCSVVYKEETERSEARSWTSLSFAFESEICKLVAEAIFVPTCPWEGAIDKKVQKPS